MSWFRKHLKLGSRLALFALVVQFAVSFGHVHAFAAQAAPSSPTSPTKVAAAISEAVLAQAIAMGIFQNQQPSNDDRDHPAGACAICAVISLAGAALFAAPPVLLLRQHVDLPYLATDAGLLHLQSARLAFQSRAPPLS
ncbi:DUF2946 family protein [Bradyrhizobium sp. CB2312]|uniref:DUF2946 family protein n=1 Tax=Bradyrhizobium sp. CB2312 TaxID=3039155 RepID=UPI0024B1AEEB|nr:DUF2946 family protein [Bradyrhizobium sp. CB2312]WFU75499.1 hypothetical protein QA642_16540 [Bradyrhizobium sp. CB2312]